MQDVTPTPAGESKHTGSFRGLFSRMAIGQCVHAALCVAAGAAIGSSRPVAETLKYLPLNRYVGMSGQKFTGNLYIACAFLE